MAAVCVVRQSICAIRENRRNGLSEPDWSMQNALAEEQKCSAQSQAISCMPTAQGEREDLM